MTGKRKWLSIFVVAVMVFGLMGGLALAEEPCERYGQGYWKQWLAENEYEDCPFGFSAEELLAMLNTPARGNADQILIYQFIAASLNINVNKCMPPPTVLGALSDAAAHLMGDVVSDDRSEILGWKDILEFWNENKYAELLSVEYVGTCEIFGSHAGETLTLTFSNDVNRLDAYQSVRVYFRDVHSFTEDPNVVSWSVEGNKVIITSMRTFNNPRPNIGDRVMKLDGILDFILEPVVVPVGGVEVVKVGGECLVDTVLVNSALMAGADSIVLKNEHHYRFKVSGTWTNQNGAHEVDAGYNNYYGNWQAFDSRNLELQVNEEFVDWGDFNPEHIYYLGFVGTGETVNFRVYEREASWYNDNSGFLTVEIFKVW